MELVIDRVSLLGVLSLVQGIVERRNTVPILGNVLMEARDGTLQVCATDLEVGIRTELACQSSMSGSITLNARKLFEVVREAETPEVSLRLMENDWVELKCGRAKFRMLGLDPKTFPAMPRPGEMGKELERKPPKAELDIATQALAAMIDKTIFAVSPDETHYNLSGVFIESPAPGIARMVATDGHRLSMIDREAPGFTMEGGTIIPRKGLAELRKLLDQAGESDVKLLIETQLAWLRRGVTELSMRLVEGDFPDYHGVIPQESKFKITLGRDTMLSAIKRAAIFSNERYHGVKLALSHGTLTISSTSHELGEASETIDTDFKGDELSVGFNAAYLIQVLNVIAAESEVAIGLSDDVSPGVMTTPADSSYQYVIMPMRL